MSFLPSVRPALPAFAPARQPAAPAHAPAPAATPAHEPAAGAAAPKGAHRPGLLPSPFGALAPSALFGHYSDSQASGANQQQGDHHRRSVLSTTAGFMLNKVDALGSKIADTAGAGSALERQAGKVARVAGHTGMALDLASGIYDGVRDPKHADEAAAQTAGSIAGGMAGGAVGGLTGPFAPIATPVLATAGGMAGGYVAGKAYPVAKQLIKDNPIGAALGAPLGPFGMVAGGLGQKGVESAAPYVHQAFDTADHLTTSVLHGAGDVAGGAKDALGDAAGGAKDFVGGFI